MGIKNLLDKIPLSIYTEDMARTIDNLGMEISTRYAEDQELFEEAFIKEASSIPSQTRISVTRPAYHSEFDLLFDLGKRKASWASFYAPPNYRSYRRRLFAEQVIPQLGTPDKQESQLLRVEAVGDEEKRKKHDQEEEPEKENAIEREKQILLKLLNNIHTFDQLLIDINSRRAQYQKG